MWEICCQADLEKRNKNKKMYHIKDDQRSIRSSEMLYEGLAKLLQEQPLSAIKVKDLVEAANVGRTTFYRNFDTIEDILRLRSDQVFDGLKAYVVEYTRKHGDESRGALLKPMLRYFYLHSDVLELLILAGRIDIIQASLRRIFEPFKTRILERFDREEDYVDYGITMRIGVLTAILIQWIKTGKKQAPDELADTLGVLVENMIILSQLL